ncbi:mediator complex subunit 13 C-terminal-domain-containing protein [Calycina marina]|uniref:Mediator of RNA polymerase II transcription subunit 13 n=1 Tax=Calycina marina TaxID=1763456 RepID=A0A9P7Z7W7_9HELO|nr:mediator complex subunit 13 C-terminal-domain-containing protein [Calycina marina]
MDPGEYLTNILASNDYASIHYEYHELQSSSSCPSRKSIQSVEAEWRRNGLLVHCDPIREGIWKFKAGHDGGGESHLSDTRITESSMELKDDRPAGLVMREKGIYEPSSLVPGRLATSSSYNSPSISSSPSSSLNSIVRNSQILNARAIHANTGQVVSNESPAPSPGIKSAGILSWPLPKDVHDCFISAVLGSMAFFLCRDYGYLPLNSQTLIWIPSYLAGLSASSSASDTDVLTLATLDVTLTSLGSLVVKGHCDVAPGLRRFVPESYGKEASIALQHGITLWLAPGGVAARYYGCQVEGSTEAPDHRSHGLSAATIKSWQTKCLDWLSAKALNSVAVDAGGWILVQVMGGASYLNADYATNTILEEFSIIPWPSLLCFQNDRYRSDDLRSKPFSLASRDPVSFAEDWLADTEARANLNAKRSRERNAAEVRAREQADIDARNIQSVTYSPAALRRGSNAGAMYPTPPDAIHHTVGATPSFNGDASTPGNPSLFFGQEVDHVPPPVSNTEMDAMEGDIWPSSGSGRDRQQAQINFHDNDNDNDDNLFGDNIGGDLFGDITDADFNFFDEPDIVQFDHIDIDATVSENHSYPDDMNTSTLEKVEETVDADVSDQRAEVPQKMDQNSKVSESQLPDFIKPPLPKNESKVAKLLSRDTNHHSDKFAPAARPPFNMEYVFKKIVQDSVLKQPASHPRRGSVFHMIDFEESLQSVDQKYGSQGRFNFSERGFNNLRTESDSLNSVRNVSSNKKSADAKAESHLLSLITTGGGYHSYAVQPQHHKIGLDEMNDGGSHSSISDQEDISQSENTPFSLNQGIKRKRSMSDSGEDVAPFNAFFIEHPQSIGTPVSVSGPRLPTFEADPADWSLTSYFTTPKPDAHSNDLTDIENIEAAQLLAEQAVSGNIKIPSLEDTSTNSGHGACHRISCTRELVQRITKVTKSCLMDIAPCTVRNYIEIQGIPVVNQGLRPPPRPTPHPRGHQPGDGARQQVLFTIASPRLEVRRSELKLTVLPSAINFWDNLGLGPCRGNKDVSAVCIYPDFDGVAENANMFLTQMRSAYESLRLGSHDRISSGSLPNGTIPFTVDPAPQINKGHQLSTLKDNMARLSKILSAEPVEERNFVVYFVYPSADNNAILVQICTAFQHLFNLHKKVLSERKANIANDVVLQLVPLDFIASPMSIVVPLPSEYNQLAMETYDRCIEFTTCSSTAAILLEQPLPRNIDFRLNPNPSASVFQENSCLHIAYAQSIDDRWITAVWTDTCGAQQMTASYCLGRKNEPLSTPFSDIASEIWETSLEIMAKKKIHWRVMMSRIGVMASSEVEIWTGLAVAEADVQVNLTLLSVQTDPSLRLLPPHITLSPNATATQPSITPASTPQASQTSVLSPEQVSTPATSNSAGDAVEPDRDARLLDFTDHSWGVVLSHRLNNSNSLLELNTVLISGYLMKRSGSTSDDPPIVMEVNIVHCEVVGNPRTCHENLIKEVLIYYRALGTLARARGIVDKTTDIRPWHIAAAEKAVKALYALM